MRISRQGSYVFGSHPFGCINSIGPITWRIVLGRLIQVRISGHMDFWLEVCFFGLTPSVNKESGTHNGSSVASKTPPVSNHEVYSDPSTKSVNVPLTLILYANRSLQRLNVPNHLANLGPRGIYVNEFLTLPLKYLVSLH